MPFRLLWMLLAVLAARGQFTVRPVATGPSDQDYPAIASGHDGRTWAAWVDYGGEGDAIPLVPLDAGSPGSDIQMNEGHGDVHRPALAVDGRGNVLCVWSEQKAGNWNL